MIATMPPKKKNELSLKRKIDLIQESVDKKLSQRELAESYGVSKTQVQRILKRKAEFMDAFESNQSPKVNVEQMY